MGKTMFGHKARLEMLYALVCNNLWVRVIIVWLICRPLALPIAICDWEGGPNRIYIVVNMAIGSGRHMHPLYIWF